MRLQAALLGLLLSCSGAAAQSTIVAGTIKLNSNLAMSSSRWDTSQAWMVVNGQTLTGTAGPGGGMPGGFLSPFNLFIGNDNVNTTSSGPGIMTLLNVSEGVGAGYTGFRTAIMGYEQVVGSAGSGNPNIVGVLGQVRMNSNQGGTAGAYSNGSGSVFALNGNAFLQSGATELLNITGMEMDTSVPTGTSVKEKHSITIIKSAADAVQGEFDDSAIEFDDQDTTSVPWNYGISFGAYAHKWPFDNTSTLIGIQNRVVPSPASSAANIGVDMTNGTFNTAQFKGTGFLVDPNGVIINSGMTTGTPTASVCLDASNHLIKKTTTGACI